MCVCCPGGPASKQSYEPLLLENEREAVSELLHHLESKLEPAAVCVSVDAERTRLIDCRISLRCRPDHNQLLHRITPRLIDHIVIQRQCRLATICCIGFC